MPISKLKASSISSGTIDNARITLDAAEIPDIAASKITSGTFSDARIAASNVSQHATGYIDWESTVKTGDFTAVAGKGYFVNTTGGGVTITMPASPSAGNLVAIVDYAGTFDTNACTISRNGSKINGATDNQVIDSERQASVLTFIDATQGWLQTSGANEGTDGLSDITYSIEYLVIAGGGAGGGSHRAGGGGSGGYRNSYASETSGRGASTETPITATTGKVFTITVGGGGAMVTQANGTRGSDSSIAASGLSTITSHGGGGGGEYQANADAGTYGAGGGAGHQSNGTTTGSDGTTGQGYDGGDITVSNSTQQGGSGGGAGAAGANGGTTTVRTGGNGLASSITGSSVTRGGGGGSGGYGNGGTSGGGTGGGGFGGTGSSQGNPFSSTADPDGYYYPGSGTANTGGGGGGISGSQTYSQTYGSGGSGVVILRMPTSSYTSTTSGSPTATTSGSDTILTFNASGSYTA